MKKFESQAQERRYYEEEASEAEFLKWYHQQDWPDYPKPSVTVDFILLRYNRQTAKLECLLIQRKHHPWRGQYALAGGFVEPHEDIVAAGIRELREETGLTLSPKQIKQLPAWSKPDRDPRGWVITNPLVVQLGPQEGQEALAGDDAQSLSWFALSELPEVMACDHKEILAYALDTVRTRLATQGLYAIQALLGDQFTLAELQAILESLLGHKVVRSNLKRNYRDQLVILGTQKNASGRPAEVLGLA